MCWRCEATRDKYVARFEREYEEAKDEFTRLTALFKDVCWYNFETECRNWKQPWRVTKPGSPITLCSIHVSVIAGRDCVTFPVYYDGPIDEAPQVPPQIVLHELKLAEEELKRAEANCTAMYDWAPGGCEYEKLCRRTLVGKRTFSSVVVEDE